MSDAAEGALVYRPTWYERVVRCLGFRFHCGDDAPNEPWDGWMQTRSEMRFSWGDRIRLLVSGRLTICHTLHLDTPAPDRSHTRLDWRILGPGEKFGYELDRRSPGPH